MNRIAGFVQINISNLVRDCTFKGGISNISKGYAVHAKSWKLEKLASNVQNSLGNVGLKSKAARSALQTVERQDSNSLRNEKTREPLRYRSENLI